jgi:hypothetical protein
MGRAIEVGLREQLIALKKEGCSLCSISEQLGLRYGAVCKLSAQLKKQGNLEVHYQNCGPKQLTTGALFVRAALWLKRLHPLWGAPFIHVKLTERYGEQSTPAIRTMQVWFRKRGLTKPRQQLGQPVIGTSKAVHNIWQVDAKENLTLLDGTKACYLTITDEHSGAGLEGLVFPPWAYRTSTAGSSQGKAHRGVSALGQARCPAGG